MVVNEFNQCWRVIKSFLSIILPARHFVSRAQVLVPQIVSQWQRQHKKERILADPPNARGRKPNSVPLRVTIISLWTIVADGLEARYPSSTYGQQVAANRPRTACACTRWGLPCLLRHRRSGALLPHLFTLTVAVRHRRFLFCGTVPSLRRGWWSLATTVSCRVRTFLARQMSGAIV